jgi:NAD(P)-dependent dehydrogenase (short-subunit alcohol dehydrogenase family)
MAAGPFSLEGKAALVTGGAKGIGRAMALALAGAGASVAVLGREEAALQAVVGELQALGRTAVHAVLDVRDTPAIAAAFDHVRAALGGLDILVNNTGMESVRPALEVSEELWDRILDTNLKGAFFCAQAAAGRMAPGSSIINLCSLTTEIGIPTAVPYGASKSGMAGMTRALAAEWAQRGIRVNGIGPGYFRTALTEAFYADPAWQEDMLRRIPLRRFGRLDELGGAAVFLASDAASYITGQILYVDGGFLASA